MEPPCYGRLSIVRSISGLFVRDLYKVRIALEASLLADSLFLRLEHFHFRYFLWLVAGSAGDKPAVNAVTVLTHHVTIIIYLNFKP